MKGRPEEVSVRAGWHPQADWLAERVVADRLAERARDRSASTLGRGLGVTPSMLDHKADGTLAAEPGGGLQPG